MNNKKNYKDTKSKISRLNSLGLVAVKDQQPTKTGDYEITIDGKEFTKYHFDTLFGWQFLLNPELYYWRECN